MKYYIDFDGVILDTEELLFKEWRKRIEHKKLSEIEKIRYVQEADWNYILNNSPVINDAIYYLKNIDFNSSVILTKVHSLTNEGSAKVNWIRRNGLKQSIILVPYDVKKSDMAMAGGNILIDDCLRNLDDWVNNGGYPILFDINDDNYDSWGKYNNKGYCRVRSLSCCLRNR